MLYCVLHQPVLVDLHLSISFEPCNSGSALLRQEAENTLFSFFFPRVQRYSHPTSWTAGVKQNRNRLWRQWRICAVGHKMQQDAEVVQGCRSEESTAAPPRATAPTRPGVSAAPGFPHRSRQLAYEKRQVVLLRGHYSTSPCTTLAQNLINLLRERFNISWFAEMHQAAVLFWYWVSLNKVVMALRVGTGERKSFYMKIRRIFKDNTQQVWTEEVSLKWMKRKEVKP